MRKRITLLILSIFLVFTLVACNEQVVNKYASKDSYEQSIINASKLTSDSTAIIKVFNTNYNEYITTGSAVVFDFKKEMRTTLYYALTTANIAKEGSNLRVSKNNNSVTSKVESYTYNEELMFGIITFKSVLKFEPIKLSSDSKAFSITNGQAVVSTGTAYDLSNIDSFKTGYITNDNYLYNDKENYFFTHSVANNYGELGSGIFNLNGEFVGLNVNKIHELDLNYQDTRKYAMLGHNIGIRSNEIVETINKLDLDNLNNGSFDIKLSTYNNSTNNYVLSELESAVKKVYDDNNEKIVKLISNNFYYSGLLIDKIGSTYSVLTTNIVESTAEVIVNNKEYESTSVTNVDDFISIVKFTSNDNLSIYSSKALNENIGIELVKGQFLVGIGSIYNANNNSLSVGSLSKEDFVDKKYAMHDLDLNYGQDGSPIFNLNGELVGVSNGKQNSVLVAGGSLIAEGLGYMYDINNFVDSTSTSNTKYISNVSYEDKIIKVLKNVYGSTVTIRTNTGLGSGVIVKKEVLKNGSYLYYVLTNHHVVTGSNEITVHFNNDGDYVVAKDFQTVKSHDMGIVRFVSSKEHDVAESAFDKELPTEEPVKGQLFISVGTPVSEERKGYVTLGNLSLENRPYKYDYTTLAIQDLNLLHDGALNPGNSGGPVFDLNGRLVAINAAKIRPYTTVDGEISAQRVGFSLSLNVISNRFDSLNEYQYIQIIKQAKLGIEITTIEDYVTLNPIFGEYFIAGQAAFIVSGLDITREGAAIFKFEDVIYTVDGKRVYSFDDIKNAIKDGTFGSSYTFEVLRVENNTIVVKTLTVKLS